MANHLVRVSIEDLEGERRLAVIQVAAVFNLGYAGRGLEIVKGHIAEMALRGVEAPRCVPSVYPLPVDRVTVDCDICVYGLETYAEVEYALLRSGGRWLVTVGADVTDALVERVSVAHAKRHCPDLVAPVAWWLDDVAEHFDELILTLSVITAEQTRIVVQHGQCGSLVRPEEVVEMLGHRLGHSLPEGAIVFSGTIGGAPPLGAQHWEMGLHDPRLGREIVRTFHLSPLESEIG